MENKLTARRLIVENLWKNILIIVIALISWPIINHRAGALDNNGVNSFLTVVSILLVTVCFANFAFSYQNSNIKSFGFRLLSHCATFLFLLLTAFFLILMHAIIANLYPDLNSLILLFSALLYLAVVLYDFWDILRIVEL